MQSQKSKKQARQGDVFFEVVPTKKVPSGTPMPSNILAQGEATGHAHKIISPSMSEVESVVNPEGDIFIKSDQEIIVGHDEHSPVTLPANEWICITRQREYDPLAANRERKVRD